MDVNESVPDFTVPVNDALQLALQNSPDIEQLALQKLQSESAVAYAKSSRGFKADLYMQFGLSQTDYIRELQNYWGLYYGLRSITGWDFENNRPIVSEVVD